ncbi:MAG: FHA domain-containing protein [Myxococcota bacterium]
MERGPQLLCLEGPLAGRAYVITAEGLRLGRDPQNEVHIDDAGVSRQHARVLLHNGAVWVQDAGSRNGIFVNGERVPDHKQVKVGDRLAVGTSVFQVSMPDAPASAPARKDEKQGGGGMTFVLVGVGVLAALAAITVCAGVAVWLIAT